MTPAKRSPDGFVAQRMLPGDRPWLLALFDEEKHGGLYVATLTDEDVADWPPLHDELASS